MTKQRRGPTASGRPWRARHVVLFVYGSDQIVIFQEGVPLCARPKISAVEGIHTGAATRRMSPSSTTTVDSGPRSQGHTRGARPQRIAGQRTRSPGREELAAGDLPTEGVRRSWSADVLWVRPIRTWARSRRHSRPDPEGCKTRRYSRFPADQI